MLPKEPILYGWLHLGQIIDILYVIIILKKIKPDPENQIMARMTKKNCLYVDNSSIIFNIGSIKMLKVNHNAKYLIAL